VIAPHRGQIVRQFEEHDGRGRGVVGNGAMMGIHGKLDIFGKFPQFESLGAEDGVADPENLFLDLLGLPSASFPDLGHGREFTRHQRGHDHVADIMQQAGQVGSILFFRVQGKRLRVVLHELSAQKGRAEAVGPEPAHRERGRKGVFADRIGQGQVVDDPLDLV